jgi:hypothetical protein
MANEAEYNEMNRADEAFQAAARQVAAHFQLPRWQAHAPRKRAGRYCEDGMTPAKAPRGGKRPGAGRPRTLGTVACPRCKGLYAVSVLPKHVRKCKDLREMAIIFQQVKGEAK